MVKVRVGMSQGSRIALTYVLFCMYLVELTTWWRHFPVTDMFDLKIPQSQLGLGVASELTIRYYHDTSVPTCDIAIRCSECIAHHMSAIQRAKRAMRKQVLIGHGNKSAQNQLASYFKKNTEDKLWRKVLVLVQPTSAKIIRLSILSKWYDTLHNKNGKWKMENVKWDCLFMIT